MNWELWAQAQQTRIRLLEQRVRLLRVERNTQRNRAELWRKRALRKGKDK